MIKEMKKIEYIICSNVNGDKENCKKTVCEGCSFKLPRLEEAAQQICQLFEKEELKLRALLWAGHACDGKYGDDGELQCGRFLPPIDFKRDSPEDIMGKQRLHYQQLRDEPKPDRLLTDEEINSLITEEERRVGVPEQFIRAEFDLDYHKMVAKAQDAKTASILRKKYKADMKHLSHLIDDVIELEEKVKSKDAECQARVDKLIASYTEYIEARKSDLTGMPSRSIPHSMALQVRRDTLNFALKAFLELANK